MTIIPAIDLIDGRCVRLTRGDFSTSVAYSDSPVETAKQFEDAGIGWLHMVDLDGARAGFPHHLHVLESVKSETGLRVDFGGGLRDDASMAAAFEHGADLVTVGSAAILQPERFETWLRRFGNERIILAADVKNERITVSGWTETSSRTIFETISHFVEIGLSFAMVTDVARDGTLEGPATELYARVKTNFPDLFVIASGGVGSAGDIADLREAGCDAAIVGKALYEGRISLTSLAELLDHRPPTTDHRSSTPDPRPPTTD